MQVFRTSVVDTVTGLQLLANGLSFNMACSFLEGSAKATGSKFIGVGCKGSVYNISYSSRNFIYDEDRCVLLGK